MGGEGKVALMGAVSVLVPPLAPRDETGSGRGTLPRGVRWAGREPGASGRKSDAGSLGAEEDPPWV